MKPTPLSFFTEQEFHQWQQVPGWLMSPAAEALYRYAAEADPDGTAVEIGSYAGKSAICIARALIDRNKSIDRLHAIDIKFRSNFKGNLAAFNVLSKIHAIEQSSLRAAASWTQPVSFLYIDGNHGKAHAYADLLVWDTQVIPGGVVALDDTIGLILGPNLQLQAALMSGAYELLLETCGVSFLRKKRNLMPGIGDCPLSSGSSMAYLHYVSSWLGAMDPAFRQPLTPKKSKWKRFKRRLLGREEDPIAKVMAEPLRVLEWLQGQSEVAKAFKHTFMYLNACLDIRNNELGDAEAKLRSLSEMDAALNFPHYRLRIREMAMLRLAQTHDLQKRREEAIIRYDTLLAECQIPEIRKQAELGRSKPFCLDTSYPDIRDVREYNLALSRYREIMPEGWSVADR